MTTEQDSNIPNEDDIIADATFEFVENEPIDAVFDIDIHVADLNYIHHQESPSSRWVIQHRLNKFPSVTVVDSAGSQVLADVTYIDSNNLEIDFIGAFAGKAYLN